MVELIGLAGEAPPDAGQRVASFAAGLAFYREQSWKQALECFEACLGARPDDGPARFYAGSAANTPSIRPTCRGTASCAWTGSSVSLPPARRRSRWITPVAILALAGLPADGGRRRVPGWDRSSGLGPGTRPGPAGRRGQLGRGPAERSILSRRPVAARATQPRGGPPPERRSPAPRPEHDDRLRRDRAPRRLLDRAAPRRRALHQPDLARPHHPDPVRQRDRRGHRVLGGGDGRPGDPHRARGPGQGVERRGRPDRRERPVGRRAGRPSRRRCARSSSCRPTPSSGPSTIRRLPRPRPEDFPDRAGVAWPALVRRSLEEAASREPRGGFRRPWRRAAGHRRSARLHLPRGPAPRRGARGRGHGRHRSGPATRPQQQRRPRATLDRRRDQERAGRRAELARQAVDRDPRSPVARLALSYAQQAAFDLEGARASVQEAVALAPDDALARARLAELWLSLGDLDRALESATEAVAPRSRAARGPRPCSASRP